MNINNNTLRLTSADVIKKRFRRSKPLDVESVRRQKAVKALQHARVVFNDGNGAHARSPAWQTPQRYAKSNARRSFLDACPTQAKRRHFCTGASINLTGPTGPPFPASSRLAADSIFR